MKNIAVLIVFALAVLGCDLSKFAGNNEINDPNRTPPKVSPTPEPKDAPKSTPKPTSTAEVSDFIPVLKRSAGKYPADIKLLDIPVFHERLRKLLGGDFTDLKAHFNVETPIEVIGDIFKAQGCEAHNCGGGNEFYIFVDLKEDNINVYHIRENVPKTFFEHGEIKLPTKFADDVSGK